MMSRLVVMATVSPKGVAVGEQVLFPIFGCHILISVSTGLCVHLRWMNFSCILGVGRVVLQCFGLIFSGRTVLLLHIFIIFQSYSLQA
jgi:hypothetical protein